MSGLGIPELIVIVFVFFQLFGGKKIGNAVRAASPADGRRWLPLLAVGIAGAIVEEGRLLAVSPYFRSVDPDTLLRISGPLMLEAAVIWVVFCAALRGYWRSQMRRNLL